MNGTVPPSGTPEDVVMGIVSAWLIITTSIGFFVSTHWVRFMGFLFGVVKVIPLFWERFVAQPQLLLWSLLVAHSTYYVLYVFWWDDLPST
jgi:hypothetical protein